MLFERQEVNFNPEVRSLQPQLEEAYRQDENSVRDWTNKSFHDRSLEKASHSRLRRNIESAGLAAYVGFTEFAKRVLETDVTPESKPLEIAVGLSLGYVAVRIAGDHINMKRHQAGAQRYAAREVEEAVYAAEVAPEWARDTLSEAGKSYRDVLNPPEYRQN